MATAEFKLNQAYDRSWGSLGPNSGNCSGFVKSLQQDFGFKVPDFEADTLIAWLDGESSRAEFKGGKFGVGEWTKLPVGDWHAALQAARAGKLVIAGLRSNEYKPGTTRGHVAVVLPKTGGPRGEPLLFGGGSAGATSRGTKYLSEVWSRSYHTKIRYYTHSSASIGRYDQD